MILENPNNIPSPSWLVFLDQKKAYDRVNHEYLFQSLFAFGFSTHFCSLIKNMYKNQTATISDKGIISESFSLERGVRQGDPLSPLLYIISLEPFLRKVNSTINGITLNPVTLKAKAYADDTTIGITLKDWPPLLNSIRLYEEASNAKINFDKSKLLQLNGKSTQHSFTSPFTNLQENETITSLGFPIKNGKLDYKGLWTKLTSRMKTKIEQVSHRNLSIRGRVLVTKSLVLSKMWYFIPVAPPNHKIKHEITSMVSKYIRSSTILPAYAEMSNHLMMGGMSSPNISNSITAILAKQFIALLTSKANWAKIARTMIETNLLKSERKLDLYQYLESNSTNTLGWPRNWKPWLVAWRNLDGSFQDSFQSPFFLKEDLTIANKPANIFTIKAGKAYCLSKTNTINPFFFNTEKPWFLLHKLPCDHKMIEVVWKLIHNSYLVGDN
jgi:hypothetical protein